MWLVIGGGEYRELGCVPLVLLYPTIISTSIPPCNSTLVPLSPGFSAWMATSINADITPSTKYKSHGM
jgi:hypothetical protein